VVSPKLVAASSVPLVLSILSHGESYGYAILQRVRGLSGGRIEWTEGMLYPVLHRLERAGMIAARWGASDTGRKRKYYRIAARGEEALASERDEWGAVDAVLRTLWEGGRA
jgi:DNA-binding PadR family transcriptional regulator